MLSITKIFYFEMAHAIHGYRGACKNIHGHSYELHVTVSPAMDSNDYIAAPGFVIDFKELKIIVKNNIVEYFDHKMILSRDFLSANTSFASQENLVAWDAEPTAENILIFIKTILEKKFPDKCKLVQLKLYETKDSYAEWIIGNTF